MPKTAAKTATVIMKQKAPKKGSVLFESSDPDSPFTAVYLTRRGASEMMGIKDLDSVAEIEISVTPK